ncbi:unnamed protein product [Commensalibacter communis]|uniref:hypothetical protein n=1 Tax=Commensalibacter communis TaxID=2972786 RepID=UPI0022FF4FFD|nr:hypothetical protein [Commensalibacter communis]CAI3953618.1 unnamed protein product [Commensalibacter communis]CAI3959167.1 unnamed protein product [Commensalibacter communis]
MQKYEQQIFNPQAWSQYKFLPDAKIKEIQLKIKHLTDLQNQQKAAGLMPSVIRTQKEIINLEDLLDDIISADEYSLDIPREMFYAQ